MSAANVPTPAEYQVVLFERSEESTRPSRHHPVAPTSQSGKTAYSRDSLVLRRRRRRRQCVMDSRTAGCNQSVHYVHSSWSRSAVSGVNSASQAMESYMLSHSWPSNLPSQLTALQLPIYIVSQKNLPPWNFLTFFPKRFGIFSQNFTRLLHVPIYAGLQICIQLAATLTKLSATTIMCPKCPSSTETHAGWSHLIWHNFVRVGDNWTKNCNLAYIWMFNRRVKFGLKIPNCLGKMSENASVCFGRWRTFCAHDVNWVVTLNNIKVGDNWIKIRSLA